MNFEYSISCTTPMYDQSLDIRPTVDGIDITFYINDLIDDGVDDSVNDEYTFKITLNNVKAKLCESKKHTVIVNDNKNIIVKSLSDKVTVHLNEFYDVYYPDADDAMNNDTLTVSLVPRVVVGPITGDTKICCFSYYDKISRKESDEQVLPEVIDGQLHIKVGELGHDTFINVDKHKSNISSTTNCRNPVELNTKIEFNNMNNYVAELICSEHSTGGGVIVLEYEYFIVTPK